MSTISDILAKTAELKTIKANIKESIVSSGGTVSDSDSFASYAAKIEELPANPAEKFGVSLYNILGTVDANGNLTATSNPISLNFSGVTKIGANVLFDVFCENANIKSVNLSSVQQIDERGLFRCFYQCENITSVNLSGLQVLGPQAMHYAFYKCTNLSGDIDFSKLTTIESGGMQYAFEYCKKITSVNFSSLKSIASGGMSGTFDSCHGLTTISFPALTNVDRNGFSSGTTGAFHYCGPIKAIHFRSDMRSTIEAMNGYSEKWGATNATIYFDL